MNADIAIKTIVVVISLFASSCAMLRIQTIHSSKAVWLSKTGDDASFAGLTAVHRGKSANTDSLVRLDEGLEVLIVEETTTRCQGRNVFIKVKVKEGASTGVEGWICGASTTHHKVGAL